MIDESRLLAVLRTQAWERAKGELRSMDHTYYDKFETFERFKELVDEFIEKVEANGYHE